MKVHISEAVVASAIGTIDESKLLQLLIYAIEGRHVVLFDTPSALDTCLSIIATDSRCLYYTAINQMGRAAAQLPNDVATIRVEENACTPSWTDPLAVLPLDKAVATLAEPLGILTENATNDWCFLCGIMRPSERDRMKRAERKGWAAPLHGGGSNLGTELPRRMARQEKGLRTFVMFDSDRRHPDELAPTWAPTSQEACQGFKTQKLLPLQLQRRHWMLKRRFIESYMPESEMGRGIPGHISPDAVKAFFRMSQHARWYFNIKKGFDGDNTVQNSRRSKDLYAGVSQADFALLRQGLGRNLGDHYQQAMNYEFNWDHEALQEASDALRGLMRLL